MKPHISIGNLDTAGKKPQVRLFQHKYLKLILSVDPFPSLQQLPLNYMLNCITPGHITMFVIGVLMFVGKSVDGILSLSEPKKRSDSRRKQLFPPIW